LTIIGCEFLNFNFEFNSLIETHEKGAYINITESNFENFNTCGSIIRNFRLLVNLHESEEGTFGNYLDRHNEAPYKILQEIT